MSDVEGRRGEARLLMGLGVPPGSKALRAMLDRVNAQEGWSVLDVSDVDLAQVRAKWAPLVGGRRGAGAGVESRGTSCRVCHACSLPAAFTDDNRHLPLRRCRMRPTDVSTCACAARPPAGSPAPHGGRPRGHRRRARARRAHLQGAEALREPGGLRAAGCGLLLSRGEASGAGSHPQPRAAPLQPPPAGPAQVEYPERVGMLRRLIEPLSPRWVSRAAALGTGSRLGTPVAGLGGRLPALLPVPEPQLHASRCWRNVVPPLTPCRRAASTRPAPARPSRCCTSARPATGRPPRCWACACQRVRRRACCWRGRMRRRRPSAQPRQAARRLVSFPDTTL